MAKSEEIAEAVRTLRAAYYRSVRIIAEDVAEAERAAEEGGDALDLAGYIAESVDASEWVTYTNKNLIAILVSHNDEAIEGEGGFSSSQDLRDRDQARAAAAMRADVYEELADVRAAVEA